MSAPVLASPRLSNPVDHVPLEGQNNTIKPTEKKLQMASAPNLHKVYNMHRIQSAKLIR